MAKLETLNDLLLDAAVIRDATEEGENTALRVGQFFVSLIQMLMATTPDESVDASSLRVSSDASGMSLVFQTITADGGTNTKSIPIPVVSGAGAGIITPDILAEIKAGVEDVSGSLKQNIGTVDVTTLDSMNSVRYATNQLPSIYRVMVSARTVGILFMYSDTGVHEITQELHTTMEPQNGVMDGSHIDGKPRTYTRSYNTSTNKWSAWRDSDNLTTLSETEFDSLGTVDPNKFYFVYED